MGLVFAVTVVVGLCVQLSCHIQRTLSLQGPTAFGSYKCPLKSPEPWGDLDVTFMAEHCAVSHSAWQPIFSCVTCPTPNAERAVAIYTVRGRFSDEDSET